MKHKIFYRAGALLLSLCMLFSLCSVAMAADGTDGTSIRGTFYFDPHEGSAEIGDLPDTYIYSDSYFSAPSGKLNAHLATMSMQMAAASISSHSYDRSEGAYATRSKNVTDLLTQLGFQQPEVNEYYNQKMTEDTFGVAVAYKNIGRNTVLLAIIPRSAGYETEWSGNFKVGTEADGLHAGFKSARDIALNFASEYVAKNVSAFSGKTLKVWTVGYSRGAGVANLIGAAAAEGYNFAPEGSKTAIQAAPENVFAYTFGTPATVLPQDGTDPRSCTYAGIHNYYSSYDPVAMLPFSTWGFTRYGQDTLLPTDSAAAKAKMLSYLSALNENVYNKYVNEGGDPDTFTAMKFDLSTKSVVPDTDAGLTQEEFFQQRIAYLTTYLAPDAETYVSGGYQDTICTLMVLMFGGDGNDLSRLLAQIQSDSHKTQALLAAGTMVVYAAMQGCADQYGADTAVDLDGILTLIGQLLGQVEEQQALMIDEDLLAEVSEQLNSVAAMAANEGGAPENGAASNLSITYGKCAEVFYTSAVQCVKGLLQSCLADVEFTNTEKESLTARLLSEDTFIQPFIKLVSAFAFGVELSDEQKAANSLPLLLQLQVNNALTLYSNSGKYMRVHNNEVLVSWLRTMDSNYTDTAPGDASSRPEYTLKAEAASHGTIQVSSDTARAGTSITVTVTPERGYELSKLTVTDRSGQILSLTKVGDGQYTFTMPASDVTLQAEFSGKAATASYGDFSDLLGNAWYRSGVEYVLENGLMSGVSATSFAPDEAMSRAMVVTVLWRLSGSPVVKDTIHFTDVREGTWYTEAIRWAASREIVAGYSDGTFGVNDAMTREQLAAVLYRYAKDQGMDVSVGEDTNIMDYDDVASISSYAVSALQWAAGEGIITGTGKYTLSPQGTATRAQCAAMIQRFCSLNKN